MMSQNNTHFKKLHAAKAFLSNSVEIYAISDSGNYNKIEIGSNNNMHAECFLAGKKAP
jgi:hypothetical protein